MKSVKKMGKTASKKAKTITQYAFGSNDSDNKTGSNYIPETSIPNPLAEASIPITSVTSLSPTPFFAIHIKSLPECLDAINPSLLNNNMFDLSQDRYINCFLQIIATCYQDMGKVLKPDTGFYLESMLNAGSLTLEKINIALLFLNHGSFKNALINCYSINMDDLTINSKENSLINLIEECKAERFPTAPPPPIPESLSIPNTPPIGVSSLFPDITAESKIDISDSNNASPEPMRSTRVIEAILKTASTLPLSSSAPFPTDTSKRVTAIEKELSLSPALPITTAPTEPAIAIDIQLPPSTVLPIADALTLEIVAQVEPNKLQLLDDILKEHVKRQVYDDFEEYMEEIFEPNQKKLNFDNLVLPIKAYAATRNAIGDNCFPFFQFSKQEKLDAAKSIMDAMENPHLYITKENRAALNNGKLHKTIRHLVENLGGELSESLNTKTTFRSVNHLIDFLNQRNPLETLNGLLDDYAKERKTKPFVYRTCMFLQFTKKDKLDAVAHLQNLLLGKSNHLSDSDISALKQGSLSTLINEFIDLNQKSLGQAMHSSKPIRCLDDLIAACPVHEAAEELTV